MVDKINFDNYSMEELVEMRKQIDIVCNRRRNERFDVLVNNFIAARNALNNEFPYATCFIEYYDEDCGTIDIDILDLNLKKEYFEQ